MQPGAKRSFIPIIQISQLASKWPSITHTFLWLQGSRIWLLGNIQSQCCHTNRIYFVVLLDDEMPKPGLAKAFMKSGSPIWSMQACKHDCRVTHQALVCISPIYNVTHLWVVSKVLHFTPEGRYTAQHMRIWASSIVSQVDWQGCVA